MKDGPAAEASFGLPTAISFGGNVHGPVLYVADFNQAGPRVLYTTVPSPTTHPTYMLQAPTPPPSPSSVSLTSVPSSSRSPKTTLTDRPSTAPLAAPTYPPTATSTLTPPTYDPSTAPTLGPTHTPTTAPSSVPTSAPTQNPSSAPIPSQMSVSSANLFTINGTTTAIVILVNIIVVSCCCGAILAVVAFCCFTGIRRRNGICGPADQQPFAIKREELYTPGAPSAPNYIPENPSTYVGI